MWLWTRPTPHHTPSHYNNIHHEQILGREHWPAYLICFSLSGLLSQSDNCSDLSNGLPRHFSTSKLRPVAVLYPPESEMVPPLLLPLELSWQPEDGSCWIHVLNDVEVEFLLVVVGEGLLSDEKEVNWGEEEAEGRVTLWLLVPVEPLAWILSIACCSVAVDAELVKVCVLHVTGTFSLSLLSCRCDVEWRTETEFCLVSRLKIPMFGCNSGWEGRVRLLLNKEENLSRSTYTRREILRQ